eukprot:Skav226192  [mRNA]  locus=scaffold2212:137961:140537:- [translate_table: standard]
MHDRTVSVPFDVLAETLMWMSPRDLTGLDGIEEPFLEAFKLLFESESPFVGKEIYKAVPQVDLVLEINGKVHEVILGLKTLRIEQIYQLRRGVSVWDVAEHYRCGVAKRLRLRNFVSLGLHPDWQTDAILLALLRIRGLLLCARSLCSLQASTSTTGPLLLP